MEVHRPTCPKGAAEGGATLYHRAGDPCSGAEGPNRRVKARLVLAACHRDGLLRPSDPARARGNRRGDGISFRISLSRSSLARDSGPRPAPDQSGLESALELTPVTER